MSFVLVDKNDVEYTRANISIQWPVYNIISQLGDEYPISDGDEIDLITAQEVLESISFDKVVSEVVDSFLKRNILTTKVSGKHSQFEVGICRILHQSSSAAKADNSMEKSLIEKNQYLTDMVGALNDQVAKLGKANSALVTLFILMSGGSPPETLS